MDASSDDKSESVQSVGTENTPTPSRTPTPSNDTPGGSLSKLPLHAGFDLNAIKTVLQEVEQETGKTAHNTPTPVNATSGQLATLPIAPPSMRSQSTPPVHISETTNPPRASSLDYKIPTEHADHPDDELTPSFSRAPSAFEPLQLNQSRVSQRRVQPTHNPLADPPFSSSTMSTALSSALPEEVYPTWDAPSTPSLNHFAATNAPAFIPTSDSNDRFPSHTTNPTFSFAGPDGFVSGSLESHNSSWSIPPLSSPKKKSALDGFNSNPWS